MADRSVAVKLLANVTGFVSGMRTAQTAATDFATKGLDKIGAHEQSIRTLTTGVGALGLAMVGFAGLAVKKFADFDEAMSSVQASTMESAENMALLREAALDAGQRTVYSATEAAAAIEELAKAGISTADILGGGLDGALDLAAAGQLAVADAAEIAASAMTQFGLGGEDVTHIADLLAAGAGKAQGGVQDLGAALNQSGLVASQMGLSLEETVGSLTAFASAGLVGSDAGTSFRAMLLRLANPTGKSAKLMDELGISVYNAQGEFIGMEGLAGQLQDRLGGLSQEQRNAALATIFGQDAIRTSAILYEQGAEGVAEWTAAVDDQGYAAEVAASRLDNLKGDLEQLGGAFETWLIRLGEGGDGALRGLVQGVTDVVDSMGDMPPAAQQAMLAIAGGGGLALLGVAALGKLTIGINDARLAMKDLGISARGAGLAVGGITAALGIATFAMMSWAQSVAEAKANAEGYQNTLDDMGNTTEATMDRINNALSVDQNNWLESILGRDPESAIDMAKKFGLSIEDLQGYIIGEGSAIEGVNAAFDRYLEQHNSSHRERKIAESEISALRKIINGEADALTDAEKAALQKAEADEAAGIANEGLGSAAGSTTDRIIEQTAAIEDNTEAARDAAGQTLSLRDAQRNLEEATDGVQESLDRQIDELAQHYESQGYSADAARRLAEEEVNASDKLDITTEAGRRNQAALDDVADAGWDLIDSMRENGASQEDLQDTMRDTRRRFIDAAESMGLSADEASDLADELNLIPDNVDADVTVNTAAAERAIDAFVNKNRVAYIQAKVTADPNFSPARYDRTIARASGGPVTAQQGYWVGENGPEWFTPSTTGMITNAAASRTMGDGYGPMVGGAPAPVVNVTSDGTGETTYIQVDARNREAAAIAAAIESRQRNARAVYAPAMGGV